MSSPGAVKKFEGSGDPSRIHEFKASLINFLNKGGTPGEAIALINKEAAGPRLCLSMTEAARATGAGLTYIYEAVFMGSLPSIKMGGRRLIKISDLEAFIDSHSDGFPQKKKQRSTKRGA